jgi:sigma-B regulation protein RsbU (phosphoserine phosphatase)
MATVRGLVRQRASLPGDPAAILGDINRHVARDTRSTGQFMTLFYAEFGGSGQWLRWVRAGHDPAMIFDPATGRFEELRGLGLALGVAEDYRYVDNRTPLLPGQIVLIGTDGIWELRNPEGRMFGKEAVRRVLREQSGRSAQEIILSLLEALNAFRAGRDPEDDVTLVVVRVLGPKRG